MALPDSFLQELQSKNDVESVIGSYVSLKRRVAADDALDIILRL